jgi:predicted RNase H-like HicB family nuclease
MRITIDIDVIIEKDEKEYYAYCPSLVGLHVDGSTRKEAENNAKNAIRAYIKSLIKHNQIVLENK